MKFRPLHLFSFAMICSTGLMVACGSKSDSKPAADTAVAEQAGVYRVTDLGMGALNDSTEGKYAKMSAVDQGAAKAREMKKMETSYFEIKANGEMIAYNGDSTGVHPDADPGFKLVHRGGELLMVSTDPANPHDDIVLEKKDGHMVGTNKKSHEPFWTVEKLSAEDAKKVKASIVK